MSGSLRRMTVRIPLTSKLQNVRAIVRIPVTSKLQNVRVIKDDDSQKSQMCM